MHRIQYLVLQKDLNANEINTVSKNKNFFYFPDMDKSEKAFVDSIEIIRRILLLLFILYYYYIIIPKYKCT